MNCAYHSHNGATVSCNGCGKPLCPACDHRIKGFPYCQDCIVLGVDLLRSHHREPNSTYVKAQTSPFAAFLLSFICPGLGAAYNGQTHKALVHFGVSVGLFQMAILSKMPLFFLGVIGMWLYSLVDSWKTARLLRAGANPEMSDDILTQRFSGNPKLWGFLLLILGSTFVLQRFLNLQDVMRVLLPASLILLGLYILRTYVFGRSDAAAEAEVSKRDGTPDFISAVSESYRNDAADVEYPTRVSAKSWKNR